MQSQETPKLWFLVDIEANDRVYAAKAAECLSGMVAYLHTASPVRAVERRSIWKRITRVALVASMLFAGGEGIFNYGVLVGNENLQEAEMLVKETAIYIWKKQYDRVTGAATDRETG